MRRSAATFLMAAGTILILPLVLVAAALGLLRSLFKPRAAMSLKRRM